MPTRIKLQVIRALWREKMHVEPRALELAPATVRNSYAHVWEPADLLMAELEALPLGLLRTWEQSERGHIVYSHLPSAYRPGVQPWQKGTLESVCYLSLGDLRGDKRSALTALYNLLDHLLGSGAVAGEGWLSDGAGLTAALQEVGARLARIVALGYGQAELAASTPHAYFASTLWLYLQDPQRLNTLDPLVHKLYRQTIMDESFWEKRVSGLKKGLPGCAPKPQT